MITTRSVASSKSRSEWRGVIGGRDSLTPGSNWQGKWQNADRAFEMAINVHNVAGNAFTGELVQIGDFGRPVRMSLEGELAGNRMRMRTTGMIRGKNRAFSCQGYLLGSRIVAAVEATTDENKPATGWLSLACKESRACDELQSAFGEL